MLSSPKKNLSPNFRELHVFLSRYMISVFAREKNPVIDSQARASSNPPVIDRKRSSADEIDVDVPSKRHQGENSCNAKEPPSDKESIQEGKNPLRVKNHGPKFLQLDPVDQQWLKKVHVNLGHFSEKCGCMISSNCSRRLIPRHTSFCGSCT